MERTLVTEVLNAFSISGSLKGFERLKRGHIHETYIGDWDGASGPIRYLHQRLNDKVFPDIAALMNNIERVLRSVADETAHPERTLELIRAKDGALTARDSEGTHWRTFRFIEGTITYDLCPNTSVAEEAGLVSGTFLSRLRELKPNDLAEVIPRFHDTGFRYEQLRAALKADVAKRAGGVRPELEFAAAQESDATAIVSAIKRKEIPVRVSHNDTKLNNILFEKASGRGVCLVDLDTCMPGSALYDFGDLVRSGAVLSAEDCADPAKIRFDLSLYEAIAKGFLAGCGEHLQKRERELLPVAPRVMAMTLGVRFLTDYLAGDKYFPIEHPEHNLERARAQFELARRMREFEGEM